MEQHRCCVCGKLVVDPQLRRIGSRVFCALHYERALAASRSRIGRSGLLEVALMAAFVALVAWCWGRDGLLGSGGRGHLPDSVLAAGLVALVPSVIWLVYIYRQDRVEPEPWPVVVGVALLGGLFGHAIARPLPDAFFGMTQWQHLSPVAGWVALLGLSGFLQQFCSYLAVRYSVYLTDEFDEPGDGVVYGVAAALGVATVNNVAFVFENRGLLPLAGAVAVSTNALIHVAAGAILGYGLGRGRFEARHGGRWIALALAASAVANGALRQLTTAAGIDGGRVQPWLSLATAVALTAGVLLAIDVLMARLCRENFRLTQHAALLLPPDADGTRGAGDGHDRPGDVVVSS